MTSEGEGSAAGEGAGTYRRVVVGVDDSAGGLVALQRAVSMARSGGAQLVAVRSWDIGLPRHGGHRHWHRGRHTVMLVYNGVQQRMESDNLIRDAFQAANGGVPDDVAVTIRTPEGDPGLVLTRIAEADGDVLVVGTEPGLRARRLVRGSVSRYCSDHARCPVVVVPAPTAGAGRPRVVRRVWGLPVQAHAGGRR
jgi:nucleotide-binding universal stress UspA family protein